MHRFTANPAASWQVVNVDDPNLKCYEIHFLINANLSVL